MFQALTLSTSRLVRKRNDIFKSHYLGGRETVRNAAEGPVEYGESIPHAKAHSPGLRATSQMTLLVLAGTSISRKRHENVMSGVMRRGPNP
jgi:hypothetical protein